MEFELVECVGQLPWVGFIIGCLALAMTIVFGLGKLFSMFLQWLYYTNWWLNWQEKRRLKRQFKRSNKKLLTEEQRRRQEKRVELIQKSLEIGGWIVLSAIGSWMIWGFIKVIICLSAN